MSKRTAVVGLGALGSMTLWQLAARGVDVTGFEALNIGCDRTGFGGETRLFRSAYQEGSCFAELLARSRDLWLDFNDSPGADVFIPSGLLTIGSESAAYMSDLLTSVAETGVEHEILDTAAISERFPQHRLLGDDFGVYDPAGGVLRSELAVISAVERAIDLGATVCPSTRVDAVSTTNGRVRLTVASDTCAFDTVVICAGAWSRPLLEGRARRLTKPLRICLTWYTARDPREFSAERFPAFIRHSAGLHIYGTPTLDGNVVKAAGVIPSTILDSVDHFDRDVPPDERALMDDAVRRFLRGLRPTCVRSDSYLDLCSEDRLPLVGWDPDRDDIYLAIGFSGRGFKMSAGVGAAVAEEIVSGERPARLAFAAPRRFS